MSEIFGVDGAARAAPNWRLMIGVCVVRFWGSTHTHEIKSKKGVAPPALATPGTNYERKVKETLNIVTIWVISKINTQKRQKSNRHAVIRQLVITALLGGDFCDLIK